tara:strand:- start:126 stop:1232 length:1107 start_codon:yes stop_codon:yes gene_type:complete
MKHQLVAGCLWLLAAHPGHAAAIQPENIVSGPLAVEIDHQLSDLVAGGFGGAVVIRINGEIVLQRGYGLSDREAGTAYTTDTIGQVGSISKTFTALAISMLAADGRVDLTAPLRTYLPDAPAPAGDATLHQVLTHRAGLAGECGGDFEPRTRDELIRTCMALPLAQPAGQEHYSNMGYSLLAAVTEEVSGQSWEEFVRQRIWTPAGMSHTGFANFAQTGDAAFAVGYLDDEPQGRIRGRIAALNGDDWHLRGNGGVGASARDMDRFYLMLSGVTPGVDQAAREIVLKAYERRDARVMEGYGLFHRFDAEGRRYRIGHSGSDGVFFSYFAFYPDHNAFLYFVGNNGEDDALKGLRTALRSVEAAILTVP